jgi:hypothetical protein
MQNLHRDHGVAEETHWLLDEELDPRRPMRVARPLPVLLRHDPAPERAGEDVIEASAPSGEAFRFALGLLAALAIYLVLRGADVGGALQGSVPSESGEGGVAVTAMLAGEPGARLEVAALRVLLGRIHSPNSNRQNGRAASPATRVDRQTPKPPATEEPVPPLQPPAPLPAPDPLTLLPQKMIEDLERATGLAPATVSVEGWQTGLS